MLTAVIILLIVLAILLILVVLVQDSKGGLAPGTNANQIMGVRKTGDIMEKLTWGFAISIMVLCVGSGFLRGGEVEQGLPGSTNIDYAKENRSVAAPSAPAAAPATDSNTAPATTDTAKK